MNKENTMKKSLFLFVFLSILSASAASAQIIYENPRNPVFPDKTGYVNDFSGIFPPKTKIHLEKILKNYEEKTGRTFLVVSFPVLNCIFQEAMCTHALSRQWGVKKNNPHSIILFISGAASRGQMSYLGLGVAEKALFDEKSYYSFISETVEPLIGKGKTFEAYVAYVDFVIRALNTPVAK